MAAFVLLHDFSEITYKTYMKGRQVFFLVGTLKLEYIATVVGHNAAGA